MNQWQQILIWQASAALHAVFLAYGSKYFTPAEQAASNLMIDALIDLPRRVHEGHAPPAVIQVAEPKRMGRPKKNT